MSAAEPRISISEAAQLVGVSVRSVERAVRILRYGVPELAALCRAGELKLGLAELVSQLTPEQQREAIARGAAEVRLVAGRLRRPVVRRCRHCGGEL